MADTFEQSWRLARLHFSNVPALLVRSWVQDAYTRLCEYRGGGWSWLRKQASMDTLASRTLTITFTQGSAAITSAAGFVASDAGRQLKVSSYPVYTIISVTDPSNATLDLPYADVGGALSSTILNAYFTCPADFKRFLAIADPYNQRALPFWATQDQMLVGDPSRTISDTGPRWLVSASYSTAVATLGLVRYEYHPYPTSERHFPYLYYRKAERFADTDTLPGVISNRADLLILGAQLQAAEWPGTTEQKNPYYSLGLAQRLDARWMIDLQQASLDDDTQYPEDLLTVNWARRYYTLSEPTSVLRASDATVYDYM